MKFLRRPIGYVMASCNKGKVGLSNIYTQSARAASPKAGGAYEANTSAMLQLINMYHLSS